MMLLKRVWVIALAFVMICYFLPKPLLAQEMAANTRITEHPIESIFTPDEAVAGTTDKKSNSMLWGLVGVVLVGGIVAAVAGGGGSSSSSGGGDTEEPGTIPVQW